MAVFTAVQPLADTFCFWVPLYYEAKLAAAVYLWANGARVRSSPALSPRCRGPAALLRGQAGGRRLAVGQRRARRQRPCCAPCCAAAQRPAPALRTRCSPHPLRPACAPLNRADLAGAQHVWARWFQPAVSQYEPVVDRRLAESKAVAKDWLHSNAMRLLALAQARALAWLASVQQQAAAAAGRPAAAHAHADGGAAEHGEEDEEPAPLGGRETRARRRAAAAAPAKRASGRGEAAGGSGKAAGGGEVPGEELQARRSSFSLATFFSARSGDLQAEDMAAGLKSLKAYPLSAGGSPELQDHDD